MSDRKLIAWLGGGGLLVALGLILYLPAALNAPPSPAPRVVAPVAAPAPVAPAAAAEPEPRYRVVDDDVYDVTGKARVRQILLVEGRPTERELRALLGRIYREQAARGGLPHHPRPTQVIIRAYSAEHGPQDDGNWLAMVHGRPGWAEPEIDVHAGRLSHVGQTPAVRHGLSEAQRKQVWREAIILSRRAGAEAQAQAGTKGRTDLTRADLMREADLARALETEYDRELARAWGLTAEQLDQISNEAIERGWPKP